MKFFIGTTNENKIREIGGILYSSGCELEVTDPIDPEETEDNFVGNAILKAKAYAKHCGGITISEDSGIMVSALNNLPGPYSARFFDCVLDRKNMTVLDHIDTGLSRTEIDMKNCHLVLDLMKNIGNPYRVACFKVVLVVASPDGRILFKESADSIGSIAMEMRGDNGFGYDPIFIGNDTFGKTYAELDSQRKNLRSHRKKVMDRFKVWLGKYLSGGVS